MARTKGKGVSENPEGSSSENQPPKPPPRTTFDRLRFKSLAAHIRYDRDLDETINPERGIDLTECDTPDFDTFKRQLAAQNWEEFTKHPEAAYAQVVREFYANFLESKDNTTVWVRGKDVKYDAETINTLLNIPNEDGPHETIPEKPDKDDQCRVLCLSSFPFDTTYPIFEQMKTNTMTLEARIWLMFICAKLLPTKSGRDVTIDRLWALYCIVNEMKINVGKVIYKEIRKAALQSKTHFFYPHLIWQLCKNQGVRSKTGDIHCEIKTVINRYHIDKYCRNPNPSTISRRNKKRAQNQQAQTEQQNAQTQPEAPSMATEQPPHWAVEMVRYFTDAQNYANNLTIYHGRRDLAPFPPPAYPVWPYAQNTNYVPGQNPPMPNFEGGPVYRPEVYDVDTRVTGDINDATMYDLSNEAMLDATFQEEGPSGVHNGDDEDEA